ncbi:MAG: hypothetical protein KKE20_02195 [Nanoarchaeota archaeon]|nr:hypothetical protein [Nanoarchaeota archaeon]
MRNILLYLIFLFCILLLGACSSKAPQEAPQTSPEFYELPPTPVQQADDEVQTVSDNSVEYIQNMKLFKDLDGDNLELIKVQQLECPGCWHTSSIFYFDADTSDVSDAERIMARVQLTFENLEITDERYDESPVYSTTSQECLDIGGTVSEKAFGEYCEDEENYYGDIGDSQVCCVLVITE